MYLNSLLYGCCNPCRVWYVLVLPLDLRLWQLAWICVIWTRNVDR
jgi:hypothetical protein